MKYHKVSLLVSALDNTEQQQGVILFGLMFISLGQASVLAEHETHRRGHLHCY